MTKRVTQKVKWGVVIVNYCCADMAMEAALSVFGAIDSNDVRVVIVDNASSDNSVQTIRDMFGGRIECPEMPSTLPKDTVQFADPSSLTKAQIEYREGEFTNPRTINPHAQFILVTSDYNGGFAAGNNIGLKLLEGLDVTHFLLLNPDAILDKNAFSAFEATLLDDSIGLAGATLKSSTTSCHIQALGGAWLHPLTLLGKNITQRKAAKTKIDYPIGAGMAFRRDWLDHCGLMDERYFLYYEEADWVENGYPVYHPAWCEGAVVYHHHGAAAGSAEAVKQRSPLADYHMIRSRLLFALKWRPWLIPILLGLGLVQTARRLARGQKRQAAAILKASLPFAPRLMKG